MAIRIIFVGKKSENPSEVSWAFLWGTSLIVAIHRSFEEDEKALLAVLENFSIIMFVLKLPSKISKMHR